MKRSFQKPVMTLPEFKSGVVQAGTDAKEDQPNHAKEGHLNFRNFLSLNLYTEAGVTFG